MYAVNGFIGTILPIIILLRLLNTLVIGGKEHSLDSIASDLFHTFSSN